VKSQAVFFPFDLFGSAGAARGVELLADALRELRADNKRERVPTRARAYEGKLDIREVSFKKLEDYQTWRHRGRQAVRRVLDKGDFLFWLTGNHLGTLPVYDELGADTLVVQFDAHLDVYNLSDCTPELSHGNFLLHCAGPLPRLLNIGNRELLLPEEYVGKYYRGAIPAESLAVNVQPALGLLRQASKAAKRVVIDIDCDVLDPSVFPAVTQPSPFGLGGQQLLQLIDACWSEKLVGICLSEFNPSRDQDERSLTFLIWLLEFFLLRLYETNVRRAAVDGSAPSREVYSS
jgi:arginase family enzyme